MAIRIALHHKTSYRYDRPVNLSPHEVRLRPAPHARTPILSYSLKTEPLQHFINWQQDPYGNYIARFVFPEKTDRLVFTVDLVADMTVINPFDFFVEKYAEQFPFDYASQLKRELGPYLAPDQAGPLLDAWIESARREIFKPDQRTCDFLVALNQRLQRDISYLVRLEPGVQTPEETLAKRSGSCRDSGWLLVQILRSIGLAARFVSGYLVQLRADQEALDGPSGTAVDFTDLHAWAEVYVPGAGWIGLDPTSGMLAGEGHIPLACSALPSSAAPVSGLADPAEVEFSHEMSVTRIHEDPRVTLPYSDAEWEAIDLLGQRVDADLRQFDVRLTQGGEPTFVSIDDMDGAEWNTQALGDGKRALAGQLALRLKARFAPDGLLHYGQGKWYPGEPLPRWALNIFWRADGHAVWRDPRLLSDEDQSDGYGLAEAERFVAELAAALGLAPASPIPAFEDVLLHAQREQELPVNLDPLQADLEAPDQRRRLARLLERGLGQVVGYVLPLKAQDAMPSASDGILRSPNCGAEGKGAENEVVAITLPRTPAQGTSLAFGRVPSAPASQAGEGSSRADASGPMTIADGAPVWLTSAWPLRRERLYLIEGDSPMGLRLPLNTLPWVEPEQAEAEFEIDPFAPRAPLPGIGAPAAGAAAAAIEANPAPREVIHTALCVQERDGRLYVFMPPLKRIEHYLQLLATVERCAARLKLRLRIEGYPPPRDPRIKTLSVTPDPGVIEVNIHPAASWDELSHNITTLYREARLTRLGTEKFMLDGRHTGTGGGNHATLGGATAADSPMLRRPDLLKSLITYWQNHPALSYLFSGTFIGPTSQAPRVDEARDDNLYELAIAFQQMERILPTLQPGDKPWMVDRLLRNLLVDLTGNTHRAEFSIDKLYSPDGPAGRLGLVEFRAFEMPPHERMSLLQMLLLRALVARFWRQPYQGKLVHWGTALHDRWMLPHFVAQDMCDVAADLRAAGYPFDPGWFDPFVEFRFPRYGSVSYDGVELELRQAIEPWNVLGEEVGAGGTARYVDSSVERMQMRVRGLTDGRHAVACNGRRLPLHPTGVPGEYVAGIRFRAWSPWSALHPSIKVQAPLVFDLVDTWNGRSLGGCTYHVAHPGGRNEERAPVNANAAEARRFARFWPHGHTPGMVAPRKEDLNPNFPMTLDLRWQAE